MILVSVVIPAYNAADRLPTALNSVLAQTCPPEKLEVIIVDDGSPDDTAVVAREHLRVTPMESQVITVDNGGPSRARNIGWQTSSGEWVQFLDDDDVLAHTKIEQQASVARTAPDDVAVLYSDWKRIQADDSFHEGEVQSPQIRDEFMLADLINADGFIHLGSALFRRSWLERVKGFEEEHWLIEDVHLLLRLAMAGGRFDHVETEEPVFFYRQRDEGSLVAENKRAFIEGCVRNARMVEQHARKNDMLTDPLRDQLTRVYFQGTRYYAPRDRERFSEIWDRIRGLKPDAHPETPPHLRMASKILGYPAAEKVAVSYRRLKSSLKGESQS
ncbi:glycosyltransferase family 2 protein [Salinibacter sp.]|uniref:glycosyltransferase family 2 protein n=1 Tax=Salinibacter sp. TaxID=2065818 RepID=UPI0021E75090|nr:glycosyltransferase family A protein [Salinibacter sp.]